MVYEKAVSDDFPCGQRADACKRLHLRLFQRSNAASRLDFKDITELEDALAPYIVGPAKDPAIGSLDYTQAVQCVVEKDGQKFTVFAYTFADMQTARRYRTGYKGNTALPRLRGIEENTIMFNSTTEYTAWYDTNILYVKGATHSGTANFMNWLEGYLILKETDIVPRPLPSE